MTESLTPREVREQVREQLATMPAGTDHNGKTDVDRAADAATIARVTAPEPVAVTEQAPMKPNVLQGGTGASVPTPAPTDHTHPLAAIREQVRKHTTTGV